MKPALISDELNNSLNSLVGFCYIGNRLLDRDLSLLNVRFVMNHTAEVLHIGFSHLYPTKLGDRIYDYQASRNNETTYPMTPAGDKNFNTPLELFNDFYEYQVTFERSVKECIEQAKEEGDLITKKFLEDFLIDLSKFTEQIILLCDKAESYGNNYMNFDRDIKKFFLFGD